MALFREAGSANYSAGHQNYGSREKVYTGCQWRIVANCLEIHGKEENDPVRKDMVGERQKVTHEECSVGKQTKGYNKFRNSCFKDDISDITV